MNMRFSFFLDKKKLFGVFKASFCIFCLVFVCLSPFYIFKAENYELNLEEYFRLENGTKIVLTLYNIETFEGGTNSRTRYLEQQALKFNEANSNCFVVVKTLSEDELAISLRNNNLPDIFSFGVGVGSYIQGFLAELNSNGNIRSDLLNYGKKNGELLAYPYILSGYTLITYDSFLNDESEFSSRILADSTKKVAGVCVSLSTNCAEALCSNGASCSESDIVQAESSYDAYKNFLSKKAKSLVGTARDLARCKNREDNGSLSSCSYKFLSSYTDLVQYVSVVDTGSSIKMLCAQAFATFLTENTCQKALANYGLFSTTTDIYDEGYMDEFEDALQEKLTSVSAFSTSEELASNVTSSIEKLTD
jgi:hypothetical protein